MVALAAISANITATAGAITNINAVGADLLGDDDIGTCATNIAAINDVADALREWRPEQVYRQQQQQVHLRH